MMIIQHTSIAVFALGLLRKYSFSSGSCTSNNRVVRSLLLDNFSVEDCFVAP